MDIWLVIAIVVEAGAVGGVVNALLTDNGFVLPRPEQTTQGLTIVRVGVLGNVIMGAVAAAVSWGLYGPSSAFLVVGSPPAGTAATPVSLNVAGMFTALLIGIGGARWLTNEVDKRLLKAAATEAAEAPGDASRAAQIAAATPAQALQLAKGMREPT